jgi:hypothetical protein
MTCTAGACLRPCVPGAGGSCLPTLPRIENLRLAVRGDTAVVDFEPVVGARDYRVYPMPDPASVLVGANGELTVRNAIYRCAGDRPMVRREDAMSGGFGASLAGNIRNYMRTEPESTLGHVYLTPGTGRQPVYRVANPNLLAGYAWTWGAPPSAEQTAADYVVGTMARDRLLAQGYRDDGVAFYVSDAGTRTIYRRQYNPGPSWGRLVVFYTDGPEQMARARDNMADVADFGERFRVLAAPADGTVPLHRVLYSGGGGEFPEAPHDVLAAGEARYQWVLHQGNQPLTSVTWPGLTASTTLVVEALDNGCPFPNGYIGAAHANSTGANNAPTVTLDEARLPGSGEVYVNGQHEPANRPRPIARAFVTAAPAARPHFDWYESFDPGAQWEATMLVASSSNGTYVYRDSRFSFEFAGCTPNHSFGPVLGQFVLGGGDGGSSCNMHVAARGVSPTLAADRFLHVRMATDIPSTGRRYPQLWITTVPVAERVGVPGVVRDDDLPVGARLGPFPFQMAPPGNDQTIVVQPFGGNHELQVEFCDRRGWGVSQQCPQANIYGFHTGNYNETWTSPWLPVPVLGDIAGWDRPVQFDVYASTQRIYVFVDGQPGGCAELPAGRMPAGPVTVLFGSVGYHMDIDESVAPANSPHVYLRTRSLNHVDRHMDDFGIELSVPAPAWDNARLPCGTRWYGGT